MTQPTLIDLHPNEHIQEFHYYPLAVKLDRCVGRFKSNHVQHDYRNK